MEREPESTALFNRISPIYGLFFAYQKKRYAATLEQMHHLLGSRILDVGCGTGALCSALADRKLEVTGVEPAARMLEVARKKTKGQTITFIQADATNRLPFEDKQFDISIASYVAHGMEQKKRFALYHEMSRVTGSRVIIHDYNANRNPFTSLIEYLERGDYFHFIKHAQSEMQECTNELRRCFSQVEVLQVGKRANWYICTPNPEQAKMSPSEP